MSTTATPLSIDAACREFLRTLRGSNHSPATVLAYGTDLRQFATWLKEELSTHWVTQVERADVSAYLGYLADRQLSGVSRARKLAAIRELFRFLVDHEHLTRSPAEAVETPKREKNGRTFLSPDEYSRMQSLAGGNPRDYAILQVFLQTGIRVSELCNLRLDDIDQESRVLRVRAGKGMQARTIELEKKGLQAIRTYLKVRPDSLSDHLFLNKDGEPLGERGVRWIVTNYRKAAGITKRASCHSLRHTFATHKAQRGVSPFRLKEWLGHARLDTTQIYVHLAKTNAKKEMEATSL